MMTYWKIIILFEINTDIKKEFDSKSVYNKKNMKLKESLMSIKLQIFRTKKLDCSHTYLEVISFDSDLKTDENYYLQVFLKEWKYIEEMMIRHIIDGLESYQVNAFVREQF